MINKNISTCCYPTRVLLIDDDPSYLVNLRSALNHDSAFYVLYDNPQEALKFLTQSYQLDSFTKDVISRPEEDQLNHRNLDINIPNLPYFINKVNRFDEISVIVIDQEMPGLKGLELCEQIGHLPIKKLMLTGEVDNEKAVKAFNEGIIDKFINKQSDNFNQTLNDTIHELQQAYFREQSHIIIDALTQHSEHHSDSCLADPGFCDFFHNLIKQHQINEYYLTNADGCFLCVDVEGTISYLTIKDKEEMHAMVFNAQVADEPLEADVMKKLQAFELIVCPYQKSNYQLKPHEWADHDLLQPAKKLAGTQKEIYYAYTKNPKADFGNVLTFREYVEKNA